jgi:Protein kinase domain
MPDEMDLTTSQTRLGESMGSSAFDHGRFAPGVVLAERYRIIGLLGRGGMGEVYRADDLTLGQSVALKFLPERIDADRASLDRLLSEVRTARQVSHPNVCRVHDVGEVGPSTGSGRRRRFISMEYIDGEDLSVLLRRIGRLPSDKGVEIARQLCAGLAASHERGVLHRDLKPANIMLDGRGRVRITDFGLATALQADGKGVGEFAGTPAYMAPEQLEGKPVTIQTDIYALGLVLYEIFTGKRFHNVTSIAQLRDRHADTSSVDLSTSEPVLDPAVARVIERCLESDPRRRPGSCALVAASLPGGDPLAAAIAAGETPSPQLVAAAAVQGALSPRMALGLGALFVAALAIVATGHRSPTAPFGISRSSEVLAAQTRDLLASLGYPDAPVDTAAGFRYRFPDWRDPRVVETARPWSRLGELRPAAVYFWYREDPVPMAGFEMGRIGLESLSLPVRGVNGFSGHEPLFGAGTIYVERAPDGSLDTLYVRPPDGGFETAADAPPVDWSRLFAEARLDASTFTPAPPMTTLAVPGEGRKAWVREAEDPMNSLRVEAAELAGRPVAFRVLSTRTTQEFGAAPFNLADRNWSGRLTIYVTVAMLGLSYLGAAFFMRRNFLLGRGDRRGALRLAKVAAGFMVAASLLSAAPPIDARLFGTLHGAVAIGLFTGAFCWSFYMAIEPYVRRQWPRVLIGWSRLMAGEWRDPQVGREVFLGALWTLVAAIPMVVAARFGMQSGVEPPLHEFFAFRTLGGVHELAGGLLQVLPWALFVALMWLVMLLMLRRLLRSDHLAILASAVLTLGIAPTAQWGVVAALFIANIAGLLVTLRVGFLGLVSAMVVSQITGGLPFSPGVPGIVGSLSWISVLALAVPALFGLYTALAGQSVFGAGDAD